MLDTKSLALTMDIEMRSSQLFFCLIHQYISNLVLDSVKFKTISELKGKSQETISK